MISLSGHIYHGPSRPRQPHGGLRARRNLLKRINAILPVQRVGWVERSDTHQLHLMEMMGFAGSTHRTYSRLDRITSTVVPALLPNTRARMSGAFYHYKRTRGRGCHGHPAFPTPSIGREISCQASGASRREVAGVCLDLRCRHSSCPGLTSAMTE